MDTPTRPIRFIAAAIVAASLVIVAGLAWLWLATEATERRVFAVALFALVILAGVAGVAYLFARAGQARIVRLPSGHAVTLAQVASQPIELVYDTTARHYAVELQRAAIQPVAQTYSPHITYKQDARAELPAPVDDGSDAIAAVAIDEWLTWIDKTPHVILAAKTGDKDMGQGGKSTTARAILAPRVARGEHVVIFDPHASGWFDLPGIGGGPNWAEIERGIDALVAEYATRMKQRNDHLRDTGQELAHDHFLRLTALVDEGNEIRRCISPEAWERLTGVLGSGARKVGISVILLMQSANVEDLGLSGPMRENFTRIALDQSAIADLIQREEKNKARRDALYAALVGRSFPAATVRRAQAHLLDRTGLDARPMPTTAQGSVWPGWATYQQRHTLPPTQPLLPNNATIQERILDLLEQRPHLGSKEVSEALGITRQQARNELVKLHHAEELTRTDTSPYRYSLA